LSNKFVVVVVVLFTYSGVFNLWSVDSQIISFHKHVACDLLLFNMTPAIFYFLLRDAMQSAVLP